MYNFEMIYRDEISSKAITVYRYLVDRAGAKGECWPSKRKIAVDLKISRSTVNRAVTELKQHGYLEVEYRRRLNGSKTSSLYKIKSPKPL